MSRAASLGDPIIFTRGRPLPVTPLYSLMFLSMGCLCLGCCDTKGEHAECSSASAGARRPRRTRGGSAGSQASTVSSGWMSGSSGSGNIRVIEPNRIGSEEMPQSTSSRSTRSQSGARAGRRVPTPSGSTADVSVDSPPNAGAEEPLRRVSPAASARRQDGRRAPTTEASTSRANMQHSFGATDTAPASHTLPRRAEGPLRVSPGEFSISQSLPLNAGGERSRPRGEMPYRQTGASAPLPPRAGEGGRGQPLRIDSPGGAPGESTQTLQRRRPSRSEAAAGSSKSPGIQKVKIGIETEFYLAPRSHHCIAAELREFVFRLAQLHNTTVLHHYPKMRTSLQPYEDEGSYGTWCLGQDETIVKPNPLCQPCESEML